MDPFPLQHTSSICVSRPVVARWHGSETGPSPSDDPISLCRSLRWGSFCPLRHFLFSFVIMGFAGALAAAFTCRAFLFRLTYRPQSFGILYYEGPPWWQIVGFREFIAGMLLSRSTLLTYTITYSVSWRCSELPWCRGSRLVGFLCLRSSSPSPLCTAPRTMVPTSRPLAAPSVFPPPTPRFSTWAIADTYPSGLSWPPIVFCSAAHCVRVSLTSLLIWPQLPVRRGVSRPGGVVRTGLHALSVPAISPLIMLHLS